jgi:hypothetical protein
MSVEVARVLGTAALLLAGCTSAPPLKEGTALQAPATTVIAIKVAPGDVWAAQIAFLKNVSADPLTIQHIWLHPLTAADGAGVKVQSITIAPLPTSPTGRDWTPGGVFKTYPPVARLPESRVCNVQRVEPAYGFVLPPGGEARILVVMQSLVPGTFQTASHDVVYTQGSNTYRSDLSVGLKVVARDGDVLRPNGVEKPCIEDSRLLPSAAG